MDHLPQDRTAEWSGNKLLRQFRKCSRVYTKRSLTCPSSNTRMPSKGFGFFSVVVTFPRIDITAPQTTKDFGLSRAQVLHCMRHAPMTPVGLVMKNRDIVDMSYTRDTVFWLGLKFRICFLLWQSNNDKCSQITGYKLMRYVRFLSLRTKPHYCVRRNISLAGHLDYRIDRRELSQ